MHPAAALAGPSSSSSARRRQQVSLWSSAPSPSTQTPSPHPTPVSPALVHALTLALGSYKGGLGPLRTFWNRPWEFSKVGERFITPISTSLCRVPLFMPFAVPLGGIRVRYGL